MLSSTPIAAAAAGTPMSAAPARATSRKARALGAGELLVAQFEGGVDGQRADPQFGDAPLLVRQARGQRRHRPGGPGRQPGGHDPHRERQVAAGLDQPQGVLPLRRQPLPADDRAEQGQRLVAAERLQQELGGQRQVEHGRSAGEDDGAAGRPRYQLSDLGGVPGVVQDDQQPSPVHQ
ncbi:hypothetical protein GCM10020254_03150 [Streptomyces goshikiensis]